MGDLDRNVNMALLKTRFRIDSMGIMRETATRNQME